MTDDLGESLRALWSTADPVPPAALAAAHEALAWRDVEAELARLTDDDLTTTGDLAHVRGDGLRLLTFTGTDTAVTIEVTSASMPSTVDIMGQLDPAAPASLTVTSAGVSRSVAVDAYGRFTAQSLPTGWTRLSVTFPGAATRPLTTEWFHA